MGMRRVVVTGLGVVAPNGIGKDAFWTACLNGKSGVGPIRTFDASQHPVKIAAEVPDFDVVPFLPSDQRKYQKIMSRAMRFAVGAAGLGITDSGLEWEKVDTERVGVVMGTGLVPVDLPELTPALVESCDEQGRLETRRLGQRGADTLYPLWLLKYLPNMVSAHISIAFHAQGPNNTITTACSAGTQAVGEAFRLIERGDADIVLAGGADSRIDPLLLLAYTALGALSPSNRRPEEVSRPFDGQRDGFVLGEGAAVLVLEDLQHARKRGAVIYAEVLGMGTTFDAYAATKPDPEARGAARAIESALREARVDHHDVDYINAHGTSTRLNDEMETRAVKRVFGDGSRVLPLSSIKSMVGHLIGAAGAVEAAALALTLATGVLPPTINQTQPDPVCDLDYVPNNAREMPTRFGVSTSFGFGGQNAALVMSSFKG
ncbi:MAG: beta-ketoacyl-[acyl-carrier-protein] synthase family protein [Gemmataceae bacterium]|nr:beta-ketoacyl-[acyl-carrier-protein] synthase family protein [Gemmataceae bacterium]MCI0740742.1 beta-ketoacyl-[acyl-carrier-protein] synthase family protein [Gemmataceae bacterium]